MGFKMKIAAILADHASGFRIIFIVHSSPAQPGIYCYFE
jgi:hypothetical protein